MTGCAAQPPGWLANSCTETILNGCLQQLQLGVTSRFHSVAPLLTHLRHAQHLDWPSCAIASMWSADTAPSIAPGPQTMPLPGVTVPLAVFGQMVLKRGITVPTERSPMHSAASRNLVHSAASRNLMHSAASRHPMHSAAAAAAAAAAQNLASHAAKGI